MKENHRKVYSGSLPPFFRCVATSALIAAFGLVMNAVQAADDTWKLDPASGDWNTAANWVDNVVPNGQFDAAFFGTSHQTDISMSTSTDIFNIQFNAGASAYTITCSPGQIFTVFGRFQQ